MSFGRVSHPHHSGSRRWSTKFRWQVGGILAITLAVIGAGFLLTSRTEVTVRVAAVNSPPFQIVSPEGKPGGAIFELLEMAAAQAEIRLVWVPVQESPESALTGKPKVDVYPLMEVRSNRKNVIHSTDAYARAELLEVTVMDRQALQEAAIGVPVNPMVRRWAESHYRHPQLVEIGGPGRLESLCSGSLSAALVEAPLLDLVLLDRPPSCRGARFLIRAIPKLHTDYAIGSTHEASSVADRLREEMGELARAGEVDKVLTRYYPLGHYRSADTFAATTSERKSRVTHAVIAGLFLACSMLWITVHQLRRRAHRAAHLADMRTQFLASISHELRTPLNGVIGLASVLAASNLDHLQKEFVGLIRSSGETLLRTVDEVLDFSKLEAGKHSLTQESVELAAVIESTVALVAPIALNKNLDLEWKVDESAPNFIISDSAALRQIFTNLVGNAVKFTESGSVRVQAFGTKGPPGYFLITVLVSDTGPGIPPDQLECIFDPFIRSTAVNAISGTGLGLSIARQLAILLGGHIAAANNPDRGCTFRFELLARSEEAETGESRRRKLPNEDNATSDAAGRDLAVRSPDENVLWNAEDAILVQENPDTNQMLVRHLRRTGWRLDVLNASDDDSFSLGSVPDVLLLEATSECEVLSLLRRARCVRGFEAVPALLIYGSANPDSESQCILPANAVAYRRPFVSEFFDAVLVRLLRPGSVPDEHPTKDVNPRAATTMVGQLDHLQSGATSIPDPASGRCSECIRERNGKLVPCLLSANWQQSTPRALVADDNPVNQKVITSMLNRLGVSSDVVFNGEEAVRRSESEEYDWVILDWQMPVMDGLDAARIIREREHERGARRTALIASSATALEDSCEMGEHPEIDCLLPKPLSLQALKEALLRSRQKTTETLR